MTLEPEKIYNEKTKCYHALLEAEKRSLMNKQTFTVTYPWAGTPGQNEYKPETYFELSVTEEGFAMHITVHETDPRREHREHLSFVFEDSCVEWFVNFMPEKCDRYFNFEVNANGAMNAAFRKDRYDKQLLSPDEIETFGIQTRIWDTYWEVDYVIPFALIEKYIPDYQYCEGMTARVNFYKCGDKTKYPHYGVFSTIPLEKPDFHRPEYFKEIVM